jgi:hypothetical protein
MTRKATWTNADGLIVGFGPNYPERIDSGVVETDGYDKVASLKITRESTFGASGAKVSLPAGSLVKNVFMKVGTAWVGGTSLAFGDAAGTGSWITATQGAAASLTVGVSIQAQGAYAFTATEGQLPPKVYAAATDLYITAVGTFTAGDATIVVEYV